MLPLAGQVFPLSQAMVTGDFGTQSLLTVRASNVYNGQKARRNNSVFLGNLGWKHRRLKAKGSQIK